MNTPEGLTPPQLYEVIAGAGNNELKGLVFGVMRDGEDYTATPLHRQVMEIQGNDPAWATSVTGPYSYCRIFESTGIAEQTIDEPVSFAVSDLGRRLALPLIGHLLTVSFDESQSLGDFHGPTASLSPTGIRPCQRRIEVMRMLRDSDGELLPMASVGSALDVRISHASHIVQDLAASKLVEHRSSGRGRPTITFTAEPGFGDMTIRSDSGKLTVDIVDFLKLHFKEDNEPISNAQIADELIADYGYEDNKTALIKLISNRTNLFASKSDALRSSRDIQADNAREAVLASDNQLATIDNLLRAIDGVQAPTKAYLNEGREKLEVIMSDVDFVKHLIHKARVNSRGLKARPEGVESNTRILISIVSNTQTPMGLKDIQSAVLEGGLNLDKSTIRRYLSDDVTSGKLLVLQTPEGDKYMPVAEPSV